MLKNEFNRALKIDKERLQGYYERIKSQSSSLTPIQIIAKFLVNQSITPSTSEVIEVLDYYKSRILNGKDILDLAFEWIRAHHFRSEYKKHLIKEQYKDYNIAVDDCIFLFFLNYDEYIRKIFIEDIKEFELSALYQVFFSSFDKDPLKLNDILEEHKRKVLTIFDKDERINERINTNILTLRSGLSEIIKNDYNEISGTKTKTINNSTMKKRPIPIKPFIFDGTMIERLIKFYCFNKNKIQERELEMSVSQFLKSYFKSGFSYRFEEFKEILIRGLTDHIYSGLTEEIKDIRPLETLEFQLSNFLNQYESSIKEKDLDGSAWTNDLKIMLGTFLSEFINNLFE